MAIRRTNKILVHIADTGGEIPTSGLETDRVYFAKDGVIKLATSPTASVTMSGATGPQGPQGNTGSQGSPGIDGDDGAPGEDGEDASANMDGGVANSTYGGSIVVEGGNASGN